MIVMAYKVEQSKTNTIYKQYKSTNLDEISRTKLQ